MEAAPDPNLFAECVRRWAAQAGDVAPAQVTEIIEQTDLSDCIDEDALAHSRVANVSRVL